jgi:hypothetical protein
MRRTGVSIEIAPTGIATRASGGPAISAAASSSVKLALPGASGTRVSPLSCWAQSPLVVEVALALDQDSAAVARQEPEREVVGERASRQKDRRFLAEQRRHVRFQLGDDAVARIIVLGDAAGLGNFGEQPRVGRRGQREPVRAELDDPLVRRSIRRVHAGSS